MYTPTLITADKQNAAPLYLQVAAAVSAQIQMAPSWAIKRYVFMVGDDSPEKGFIHIVKQLGDCRQVL